MFHFVLWLKWQGQTSAKVVGIVSGHGNFKKGLIAWISCLSGYCSNLICGEFRLV